MIERQKNVNLKCGQHNCIDMHLITLHFSTENSLSVFQVAKELPISVQQSERLASLCLPCK